MHTIHCQSTGRSGSLRDGGVDAVHPISGIVKTMQREDVHVVAAEVPQFAPLHDYRRHLVAVGEFAQHLGLRAVRLSCSLYVPHL